MQSVETQFVAHDSVLDALARVLASPGFTRSDRFSAFLRFVVQQTLSGHGDQIKETVIGVEVFGPKPDYDPRTDPVVRMEAGKLRARMAEYYGGAGAQDPLRIEIPKGGYAPRWQREVQHHRFRRLKLGQSLRLPSASH